jgi:hypothetical protein
VELVAGMHAQLAPLTGAAFGLAQYRQAIDCALHTGRSQVFKTVFKP